MCGVVDVVSSLIDLKKIKIFRLIFHFIQFKFISRFSQIFIRSIHFIKHLSQSYFNQNMFLLAIFQYVQNISNSSKKFQHFPSTRQIFCPNIFLKFSNSPNFIRNFPNFNNFHKFKICTVSSTMFERSVLTEAHFFIYYKTFIKI